MSRRRNDAPARRAVIARTLATAGTLLALATAVVMAVGLPATHAADTPTPTAATAKTAVATFAAGCFWCVEKDFDKVAGVVSTTSGYTGGRTENPDYASVSSGRTGHTEALEVAYDPGVVTYEQLLATFWRSVDAVDGGGQFCDRGPQYRPAIFVHSPEQRRLAEASKTALQASGRFDRPIAVTIEDAKVFTSAEIEHQDYYKKSPIRYAVYRHGCGRDQRLQQIWGSKASG